MKALSVSSQATFFDVLCTIEPRRICRRAMRPVNTRRFAFLAAVLEQQHDRPANGQQKNNQSDKWTCLHGTQSTNAPGGLQC